MKDSGLSHPADGVALPSDRPELFAGTGESSAPVPASIWNGTHGTRLRAVRLRDDLAVEQEPAARTLGVDA